MADVFDGKDMDDDDVLVPLDGLSSSSEEKLLRRYLKGTLRGRGGGTCFAELPGGTVGDENMTDDDDDADDDGGSKGGGGRGGGGDEERWAG